MDMHEKMQIAHSLEELKVDVIEAGFPIASSGDFKSVSEIAVDARRQKISHYALSRRFST